MNRLSLVRIGLGFMGLGVAIAAIISGTISQADPPATSAVLTATQTREALVAAFQTNLGYCRDWLADKDFKSLKEGTSALLILSEAIGEHTDDNWKDGPDALHFAVEELAKAAEEQNSRRAQHLIEYAPKVLSEIQTTPCITTARIKKTSAGFTPLMHLIDGTFTDAKTALATQDVAAAKSDAVVIADLAQWLAADRGGEQWKTQSAELGAAAQSVATSSEADPKALRVQLHEVYARCAACHARAR